MRQGRSGAGPKRKKGRALHNATPGPIAGKSERGPTPPAHPPDNAVDAVVGVGVLGPVAGVVTAERDDAVSGDVLKAPTGGAEHQHDVSSR